MIKLLVGSSAGSAPLAKLISAAIDDTLKDVAPILWRSTSSVAHGGLAELLRTEEFQLALMVFGPDDLVRKDGLLIAPLDNILVETGMLTGRLGPRRAVIVLEAAARCPAGLTELPSVRYSRSSSNRKIAADVAQKLHALWHTLCDPTSLGIEQALRNLQSQASAQLELLYFPDVQDQRAVTIDSRQCMQIYHDGLKQVRKRFWTTTFFESAFWSTTHVDNTLDANRDMMTRLRNDVDASARRAFLLPSDAEEFFLEKKREIRKLRHADADARIQLIIDHVSNFRARIQRMSDQGFEIRVVRDLNDSAWNRLVPIFHVPNHKDTEIAIYDDFRIDLYSGGAHGLIDQVFCIPNTDRNFATYMSASLEYFDHIWRRGHDADEFMDAYEDSLHVAAHELDHEDNWFAQYDLDLSKRDGDLKEKELSATIRRIKGHFPFPDIRRYLDIGSCTGRYPLNLLASGWFCEPRTVIALENNQTACRLMREKFRKSPFPKEYQDIKVVERDFMGPDPANPSKAFDLITCMLGTLSHLAAPGRDGASRLQLAIEKMAARLAPHGALMLGCWSDEAVKRKEFLSIYTPHDKIRLQRWSPTHAEIARALDQAGLHFKITEVDPRLNLYYCTQPTGAARRPPAVG